MPASGALCGGQEAMAPTETGVLVDAGQRRRRVAQRRSGLVQTSAHSQKIMQSFA
jgi:hypothetical protein